MIGVRDLTEIDGEFLKSACSEAQLMLQSDLNSPNFCRSVSVEAKSYADSARSFSLTLVLFPRGGSLKIIDKVWILSSDVTQTNNPLQNIFSNLFKYHKHLTYEISCIFLLCIRTTSLVTVLAFNALQILMLKKSNIPMGIICATKVVSPKMYIL